MRQEYARVGLHETDLAATWLDQFRRWLADAVAAGLAEPNAMVLATAGPHGRPSARTVLLKDLDERGFGFFTNLTSRKAIEVADNPYASLVFPWHQIERQVVVGGRVEPVDRSRSEEYFASRPIESQLGAWASPQSRVVASREELDEALERTRERFRTDRPVPAPPQWGGLRVTPETVEFWQGRIGRLHDRLRFRRDVGGWVVERLAP
jgi:pyridoxamine 5'-phosphate oxidase